MRKVRFIGLDVHADTIAVAVAEPGGEVRSLGVIPNRPESIRKLMKKLGPAEHAAGLLRGGPDGLRDVLAADGARRALRGGRADAGADEGRRSGEDGPPRCGEAGAELPRRRLDAGVGAGRGARSAAGSGAGPRGGEEGPAARAPSARASFCCATAGGPPTAMKAWTQRHLAWVKTQVHFEHPAQEATLLDYLHEVEHAAERIERLERAIDEAVKTAPPAHARGDRRAPGAARDRAGLGRDDRRRSRRALALRASRRS